jgi:hypothetical protein
MQNTMFGNTLIPLFNGSSLQRIHKRKDLEVTAEV